MVWVRLDDHFDEHRKTASISDSAALLFVAGLCYSNRHLTDGFIPLQIGLRQLRGASEATAAELVAVGMWETVERGWRIHDFPDFQPTRDEVEHLRDERARAGRAGAEARWSYGKNGKRDGNCHDKPIAKSCPVPVPVPVPVPSPGPRPKEPLADPTGFGLFWMAYPKKVKKAKARVAWNHINPSNGLLEKILAALETHKRSREWNEERGKYIPHPTSWLNARRWEDELPVVAETPTERLWREAREQRHDG